VTAHVDSADDIASSVRAAGRSM